MTKELLALLTTTTDELRCVKISPLVSGSKDAFDQLRHLIFSRTRLQHCSIRLGIARGLIAIDPELRGALKRAGFLSRDAREKESKNAFAFDEPSTPPNETMQQHADPLVQEVADAFEAPLSKKEKKKREKEAQRQSLGLDGPVPEPPARRSMAAMACTVSWPTTLPNRGWSFQRRR